MDHIHFTVSLCINQHQLTLIDITNTIWENLILLVITHIALSYVNIMTARVRSKCISHHVC